MAEMASTELNLRELRILNALLHERSITRTAELLATTQPAISKVLRHLRAQFGEPLFVRNGHAMQPTVKAVEIADQLRTLLHPASCAMSFLFAGWSSVLRKRSESSSAAMKNT